MSPASKKNNLQAFERFNEGIMPQFKVRNHEIASSKSLLLVKKDPWNLMEDFYQPEEEFIYFENFDELKERIQDVSVNFEKYEDIVEAAFLRSKNYTAERIYRYIQTNDKSLITWRNKYVC
jgi:spore maturation protein CgeB